MFSTAWKTAPAHPSGPQVGDGSVYTVQTVGRNMFFAGTANLNVRTGHKFFRRGGFPAFFLRRRQNVLFKSGAAERKRRRKKSENRTSLLKQPRRIGYRPFRLLTCSDSCLQGPTCRCLASSTLSWRCSSPCCSCKFCRASHKSYLAACTMCFIKWTAICILRPLNED